MLPDPITLDQAHERREADVDGILAARQARQARQIRPSAVAHPPHPGVLDGTRRRVGIGLVRLGARLLAEPR